MAFNQRSVAQANAALAVQNAATATYAQGQALYQAATAQAEAAARATAQAEAEAQRSEAEKQRGEAQTQAQLAETQRQVALKQASIGLANSALLELEAGLQDRGLALALENIENYPYTTQAEQALGQVVLQSRLYRVMTHDNSVLSIVWSPDGKRLVSASDDGTARVWEAATGKELSRLEHNLAVNFAVWSPDGRQVLTTDDNSGVLYMWDSQSGEQLFILQGHTDFVNSARWSPDGTLILTASDDTTARIWDAKSGALLTTLEHLDMVQRATWSPDGKRILCLVQNGTPVVWDAATLKPLFTLAGHTDRWVFFGEWSPSGDRIVTSSSESAWVWDGNNGELLYAQPSGGPIVSWSPAGDMILAGEKLFDAVSGEERLVFPSDIRIMEEVWSPTGDRVAFAYIDGKINVWDAVTGDQLFSLRGHRAQILHTALEDALAWSPDGRWLASAGRDGTVLIWDTAPLFSLGEVEWTNAQWSPKGDRILSSEIDQARIFDAVSGELLLAVEHGLGQALSDYWSPTGDKFGLGFTNGDAKIYDAASGAELFSLAVPGGYEGTMNIPTNLSWSPDGKRIVTTHRYGGYIKIWDAATGAELATLRGYSEELFTWVDEIVSFYEVAWSPTEEKILTVDDAKGLLVWDASSGVVLLNILPDAGDSFWDAAWSPDGKRIATHSRMAVGAIWDAATGEKLAQFSTPTGEMWAASWSPSGDRIATGGYDGDVQVWDTHTGEQVLYYPLGTKIDHLDWSPDGSKLLVSMQGDLLVLPVWNSTQELIDYAHACCLARPLTPAEREQFGLSPEP